MFKGQICVLEAIKKQKTTIKNVNHVCDQQVHVDWLCYALRMNE